QTAPPTGQFPPLGEPAQPPPAQPAPAPPPQAPQPGGPQPAPAQPPPAQPMPPIQPVQPAWGGEPPPPRTEEPGVKHEGIVIVPRVGIRLVGSGTGKETCDGNCTGFNVPNADYDDKTAFGFGVDVLGHLIPALRIGGGLFWAPASRVQFDGDDTDSHLGSDL